MAPKSNAPVKFVEAPITYIRWAARVKPAIFWSIVIGCMGPVSLVVIPPIRMRLGDPPRPFIPHSYPIPKGPRQIPQGYDD